MYIFLVIAGMILTIAGILVGISNFSGIFMIIAGLALIGMSAQINPKNPDASMDNTPDQFKP